MNLKAVHRIQWKPVRFGEGSTPAVKYSALFLPPDNVLARFPVPPGWERFAHHCTVEYQPKNNRLPGGEERSR